MTGCCLPCGEARIRCANNKNEAWHGLGDESRASAVPRGGRGGSAFLWVDGFVGFC